jgi:hypothetical protein
VKFVSENIPTELIEISGDDSHLMNITCLIALRLKQKKPITVDIEGGKIIISTFLLKAMAP